MKKYLAKLLVLILVLLLATVFTVVANEPELEPSFLYLTRTMGLFENKYDTVHVNIVSPQAAVTVLERHDNWVLINTWLGPRWINLDFTPPTSNADNFIRRFPNTAIFYKNIETGFTYTWNADSVFFGASLSKASYALYLYQRAERGEIDLDYEITLQWQDWHSGSGVILHRYGVGHRLTTGRLIELSLYQSDNIATMALRRVYGIEGYMQFIRELGANPSRVRDRIMNSDLTANEVGIFARAIFDYIESDATYSQKFKDALINNQFPFQTSDYVRASKTGWTNPSAWHDMSIVYAPSPYILVIMSRRRGWQPQDYQDFADISMFFQEFNDRWF